MQPVLERGSIDKPLTFDVGLIQLSFHTSLFTLIHATFQSNCAKGLHYSAFIIYVVLLFLRVFREQINNAKILSRKLAKHYILYAMSIIFARKN